MESRGSPCKVVSKIKSTLTVLQDETRESFIALVRLLAGTNSCLDQHLRTGPANAKYISKNIQNEILEIAADQIRDFYREYLREWAHFSVVADEVTSHGQEILSVCLRFLEVQKGNFELKPKKHEVLLDFAFLQRITGESIAHGILCVLEKHKIDIRNCRGQAYDTTSSMSSSSVGVKAHIKRVAPDADYQGCCLHSLNLVLCKSSQITAIRNMFDSCQQAYLFFHNSPKRQRFLEHVISCQCPATKKTKINGLCKTRWVERHTTFDTILELYTYLIETWNEICYPSNCDKLYPDGSNWKWNSETRTAANGLRYTFVEFEHIVVFMLVKQLLEPIRPIAECLQARLQELYFGFKKVDEVVQFYKRIRNDVDVEHNRIYAKAKKLAADIGSDEAMPRIIKGRQRRANPTVLLPCDYWRVALTIPFLDSILSELESRFASDKREHFELCVLVPEFITKKESLEETVGILTSKWGHLMPTEDNFESELIRWRQHCHGITEIKSITQLLSEDADLLFFSNVRELLCILAVLPIGSAEAERSFSCLRQVHTWLRTTMTCDKLGNLGVLALHGFDILLNIEKICSTFRI